jgi:hypothetical protein
MNAGKFSVFVKNLFVAASLLALASLPANAELLIGISFPSQGGGDNDVVAFDSTQPGTIIYEHPISASGVNGATEIDESLLTSPKLHLQGSSWFGTENRTIPSTLYWCETTFTIEFSSKYIEYFTGPEPSGYEDEVDTARSDQREFYSTTLDAPTLAVPREVLPPLISLRVSEKEPPRSSAASAPSNSSTSGPPSHTAQPVTGVLNFTLNQNTLQLDWPADHIGWILQTQTNPGINSQWFSIPGSSGTNHLDLTLDRANTSVFFRLIAP